MNNNEDKKTPFLKEKEEKKEKKFIWTYDQNGRKIKIPVEKKES